MKQRLSHWIVFAISLVKFHIAIIVSKMITVIVIFIQYIVKMSWLGSAYGTAEIQLFPQ